jgi:hypothetical protein
MRVNMVDVSIYENRRMKPVEIVLRRGGEERRENDGGVNLPKVYHKHICRYNNASPEQLLCVN